MQRIPLPHRCSSHRQRGATTIEFVGLAVAVALLLGGVGQAIGKGGGAEVIARAIPDRIADAFEGGKGSRVEERRAGATKGPARVSRDDLRMDPIVPTVARAQVAAERRMRLAGFDVHVEAKGCALCLQVGERHSLVTGAIKDSAANGTGAQVGAQMNARAALVAGDLGLQAQRTVPLGRAGDAVVTVQGRASGTVGAEIDIKAKVTATRGVQAIDVGGTAMAGAAGKGETRVGLELLGISITQTARGEGWAGAGARGTLAARRDATGFAWNTDWGAALGLGGSGGWGGTIDISGVSPRHRALAGSLLATASRMARPAFLSPSDSKGSSE